MNEHKNNLAEIEKPSTSYMLPPINAHNEMYTTLAQNLPQTADQTELHTISEPRATIEASNSVYNAPLPGTPQIGLNNSNLPSVLYLDHAQIKLLTRRLEHIKDKLNVDNLDFMKTAPKHFADHILSEGMQTSDKINVINNMNSAPNSQAMMLSDPSTQYLTPVNGPTHMSVSPSKNSLGAQQALSMVKPKNVKQWIAKGNKHNTFEEPVGQANKTSSSLMQKA